MRRTEGTLDRVQARAADVDFATGKPDVASFPMRDWLWALNEAGRTARVRVIGIQPMANYYLAARDHPPQLVLGFGDLTEEAIRRGVAAIGDLLDPS